MLYEEFFEEDDDYMGSEMTLMAHRLTDDDNGEEYLCVAMHNEDDNFDKVMLYDLNQMDFLCGIILTNFTRSPWVFSSGEQYSLRDDWAIDLMGSTENILILIKCLNDAGSYELAEKVEKALATKPALLTEALTAMKESCENLKDYCFPLITGGGFVEEL